MLSRTKIRRWLTDILSDPETGLPPQNHNGLTLAGDNVFDTLLSPPQFDNESSCASSDDYDLPAIAVYTEDESFVSDPQELLSGCFNSTINVVIELYVCAKDGIEMEELLDSLEAQVRYKIIRGKAKPFTLQSYKSYAVRNDTGRRLGMRRIDLSVSKKQSVTNPEDYHEGVTCIAIKIPDISE